MLQIPSDIEGKHAYYGEIRDGFEKENFYLGGNWEYYDAFFDSVLTRDGGMTMYVRLPVKVIRGKLDRDDAYLEFGRPLVLKHILHTGFVEADLEFAVLDVTGLNQFHKPLDPDDRIENTDKWRKVGEQAIERIKKFVH